MKSLLIFLIDIYQKTLSAILKNILGSSRMCRFSPTCSEYAKTQIKKYGIITGIGNSVARLLKCQPFIKI